jgi:hypothetical protein
MVTMVTDRKQTKEAIGAPEHNFQFPGQQKEKFYSLGGKMEIIKKGVEGNDNLILFFVKFKKQKELFISIKLA